MNNFNNTQMNNQNNVNTQNKKGDNQQTETFVSNYPIIPLDKFKNEYKVITEEGKWELQVQTVSDKTFTNTILDREERIINLKAINFADVDAIRQIVESNNSKGIYYEQLNNFAMRVNVDSDRPTPIKGEIIDAHVHSYTRKHDRGEGKEAGTDVLVVRDISLKPGKKPMNLAELL